MKSEHIEKQSREIVRQSLEEIKERIARGETGTDPERLENMTEEEIEQNALEDNREHGISDDWYEEANPVMPEPKELISIRLDKDVLEWFRSQGEGYQTRINAVLRAYMGAKRTR